MTWRTDDGQLVSNRDRPLIADLDELPPFDYSLLRRPELYAVADIEAGRFERPDLSGENPPRQGSMNQEVEP